MALIINTKAFCLGRKKKKGRKQDILVKGISEQTLSKSQPDSSTTLFLPTLLGLSVLLLWLPFRCTQWRNDCIMFFLPVQFVAHTRAEWAGSTPHYPPTLRPMLMKSWFDRGVFVRQMEACWALPGCKWQLWICLKLFPDIDKHVIAAVQTSDMQGKLCLWTFRAFQNKSTAKKAHTHTYTHKMIHDDGHYSQDSFF